MGTGLQATGMILQNTTWAQSLYCWGRRGSSDWDGVGNCSWRDIV